MDTALDPANCGACGNACAQGELCSAGNCGLECAGGTTKCGSACVSTQNDPAHCGGCGKACAGGEACSAGKCVLACGQGLANCGGKCVDTQSDAANCAGCGKACAGTCAGGACHSGLHLWSKLFGDGSDQYGTGIAVDGSGNALVTGMFTGTVDFGGGQLASAGGEDIFVAKLDKDGKHLWSKRFGDASHQEGHAIAVDALGNVLVAGMFTGTVNFGGGMLTSAGSYDGFVAKLGPDGTHLWSKRFGDASDQRAYATATDASGNVVLAGYFHGSIDLGGGKLTSAGGEDIFVAKYDKDGAHLWSKRFGDASAYQEAYGIATDASGNVALAGRFYGSIDLGGGKLTSAGHYDGFVARLGPDGTHLWSNRFGDGSEQTAQGIATDASGNVGLAGHFYGSIDLGGGPLTSAGGSDIFVAKYDKDGKHLWSKRFGDASDEQDGTGIAVDGSGNAIVTGEFQGTVDFGGGPLTSADGVNVDVFVAKFDQDGQHLWSKRFGGGNDQWGTGIAVEGSGSALVTGTLRGTVDFGGGQLASAGLADIFVAKFGP
ncbi:MAG: SBBP repeat-containing protein [Deltaproteobacteria bacterium]|nr:SBBP repeat-containing protein [Deltaproteobacteria bacterium]